MAKIHPQVLFPHSSSINDTLTSKKETFTIWMKSLILSSKGCTVFNSSGQIVYRVDNYNCKNSNEVYLMDVTGKALFTIRRKKSKLCRTLWEGYRSSSCNDGDIDERQRAAFRVREKRLRILGGDSTCEVIVWLDKDQPSCHYYQIESCAAAHSLTFNILDKQHGRLIAEVKRKQSKCGVSLGEDVLSMVVEPHNNHIDHSLIMGLIVAYGLINSKM